MKQYLVAQEVGVSPTTLIEWETGKKPLPPGVGERLLAAVRRLATREGACFYRATAPDPAPEGAS